MTWTQINRALVTGFIELQAADTKTGRRSNCSGTDNLRAWLIQYRREAGSILPAYWLSQSKSGAFRLAEITRYISRTTGVVWKDNAPRHSYGTYLFKLKKDPGLVTAAMGTSWKSFRIITGTKQTPSRRSLRRAGSLSCRMGRRRCEDAHNTGDR